MEKPDNKLASRLSVVPFFWIPIGAAVSILRNEPENSFLMKFLLFAIVYLIFTGVSYLIFKKLTASKQLNFSNKRNYLFLSIIILQHFLLTTAYSVKIFVSWESLFLTVPVSFAITLLCTIMMTKENVNRMQI
jgi:hypothetical protein